MTKYNEIHNLLECNFCADGSTFYFHGYFISYELLDYSYLGYCTLIVKHIDGLYKFIVLKADKDYLTIIVDTLKSSFKEIGISLP